MQVSQMRDQAQNLRKSKQYDQALALYEVLWREHRDACDKWDGWGYAYCLRKLGRTAEAVDVSREVYEANLDFEYIKNVYGWSLYDLEISKSTEEIAQNVTPFFRTVNAILEISDPYDRYSPYVRTVMKVIDYFNDRATYSAEHILNWTEKLKPDMLSLETSSGKTSEGRVVEYPSDRERWYAWRSKALYEGGRYEECVALSDAALQAIPRFHFSNDVWIRWRRALAKGQMGDREAAIADLDAVLQDKHDWFLKRDMARLLYEEGRLEEALEYAAQAALDPGDLEYKWELFLLMGQILNRMSNLEEARKHVLLAAALREEHEWKATEELEAMLAELDVDAPGASSRELRRELASFWRELKFSQMPQMTGRINNLVGNGNAAFIRGDDGNDYYFKVRSFRGPRNRVQPGVPVRFRVQANPDPNKRDIALDIVEVRAD